MGNSKAVRFSIIIPTCGRPTLERTLASIAAAGISPADQVIVIGDGTQREARAIAGSYGGRLPMKYLSTLETTATSGNNQRHRGMEYAKGTHLLFIDDDDAYRPGALDIIRTAAEENPGRILIFKMQSQNPRKHAWAPIRWIDYKDPFVGNVGTPMFCIPNIPDRLGRWQQRLELGGCGDFNFLESTLAKWPEGKASIVWRDEIIVDVY